MTANVKHILLVSLCGFLLSACTAKLPDFNMPSLSDFKESASNLTKGYPKPAEAPVRPSDLRSADAWDESAKALVDKRSAFVVPEETFMPESPEAVASEIATLKAKVHSYKLDDPQ